MKCPVCDVETKRDETWDTVGEEFECPNCHSLLEVDGYNIFDEEDEWSIFQYIPIHNKTEELFTPTGEVEEWPTFTMTIAGSRGIEEIDWSPEWRLRHGG